MSSLSPLLGLMRRGMVCAFVKTERSLCKLAYGLKQLPLAKNARAKLQNLQPKLSAAKTRLGCALSYAKDYAHATLAPGSYERLKEHLEANELINNQGYYQDAMAKCIRGGDSEIAGALQQAQRIARLAPQSPLSLLIRSAADLRRGHFANGLASAEVAIDCCKNGDRIARLYQKEALGLYHDALVLNNRPSDAAELRQTHKLSLPLSGPSTQSGLSAIGKGPTSSMGVSLLAQQNTPMLINSYLTLRRTETPTLSEGPEI